MKSNTINKKKKINDYNEKENENENIEIKNNNSVINENKGIEINRIKGNTNSSNKPFSNIKFNSRNTRNINLNRNDSFKGQFSLQKDQTDRGLLKSSV